MILMSSLECRHKQMFQMEVCDWLGEEPVTSVTT